MEANRRYVAKLGSLKIFVAINPDRRNRMKENAVPIIMTKEQAE
jgi:hypothetical protein